MSSEPKRPAHELRPLAERIVEQLRPYCHRIEIAGSLRRGVEMVGDIEIVCEPKVETRRVVADMDLFGSETVVTERTVRLDDHVDDLVQCRQWQYRPDKNGNTACGPRYKRLLVEGVALDLFSVLEPASWGVILAIRTGPAEFSRRLVTQRNKGGWLLSDCRVESGAVWQNGGPAGDNRVALATEADLFRFCGLDWIEPVDRK